MFAGTVVLYVNGSLNSDIQQQSTAASSSYTSSKILASMSIVLYIMPHAFICLSMAPIHIA